MEQTGRKEKELTKKRRKEPEDPLDVWNEAIRNWYPYPPPKKKKDGVTKSGWDWLIGE